MNQNASLLAIGALALLAACGSASDPEDPLASEWGPLAVVPGSDAGDAALIQGALQIDDRCVLLDTGDEEALLIWPDDRTSWDADRQTVTFVRNNGQALRFEDGQQVSFGGGGSSRGEDGQTADEFTAAIDWVAAPDPDCVMNTRWFIYEVAEPES